MDTLDNKIFFLLKEHALIHQVIVESLLNKKYFIHELAVLLGVDVEALTKVRNGLGALEKDCALKLIQLFYTLNT